MARVLVLVDCLPQAEEIQRLIATQRDSETKYFYPSKITQDRASYNDLYVDCRQVIFEEEIETILCLHPENFMLQAALIKRYDHLKGPSFESSALCFHKFYNIRTVLSGFSLGFERIEVEDAKRDVFLGTIDIVGTEPAIYCDAFKASTVPLKMVTKDTFTIGEVENIRKFSSENIQRYRAMIRSSQPQFEEKYPLMFEPIAIVSENWRIYCADATYHQVECVVAEQELIPWAITDYVMYVPKRVHQYTSMPTSLGGAAVHEIWGTVGIISERLMSYGFDDQFCNFMVMCTPSGCCKVIEMNIGIVPSNSVFYRHVLCNGDNLKAAVQVGKGQMVREPRLNPKKHIIRAELRTFNKGSMDAIIDQKQLQNRSIPDMDWIVRDFDAEIKFGDHDGGLQLANFLVHGTDLVNCLEIANERIWSLVKPNALVNWEPPVQPDPMIKAMKFREKTWY